MDPLAGDGAAQVLDVKVFVLLFGNAQLQGFTHSACVNTTSVLHGIFEGLEAHLLQFKASLASSIGRATEAGPGKPEQNADVLQLWASSKSIKEEESRNSQISISPS